MKSRIAIVALAVTATVALVAGPYGVAGAAQHGWFPPAAAAQTDGADMMKRHQQMMADMKKADAELATLVDKMNASKGSDKVDAIAAAVTELARGQASMHERMAHMHMMMMGGREPQSGGTGKHQH